MRVYLNQLDKQLKQGLPPVIMLFGDEPYQLQQTLDAIRAMAKQQGCEERVRFTHDNQFNWQAIFDEALELSLFASRKLIEVEMPSVKPGREGGKQLQAWLKLEQNEHILLLWGGKVAREQTNGKWFKALDSAGWYIPVYDIEREKFPAWLQQQFNQHRMQVTPNAIALLAELFEGNLLSAAQEITRLNLLHANQLIDVEQVEQAVSDQSRFTVFQLVDDLLAGKFESAAHILQRLQGEDLEPVIISWALQKEADTLAQLLLAQQETGRIDNAFKSLRIWQQRQGLYRQACQRMTLSDVEALMCALSTFDTQYKTQGLSYPYTQLAHCCALFTADQRVLTLNQFWLADAQDV